VPADYKESDVGSASR